MIWILLFTLIFATGSDSVLMNPKLKKHVRKYVEDKDRKSNILDLIKTYEKEAKLLYKSEKKKLKVMDDLNTSRSTTIKEFQDFFNGVMKEKMIN